jgi:hypothetical protein
MTLCSNREKLLSLPTERIAFPAGGIAAIVIATVVIVMVVAKVVCVVTGYERRLPNLDCDTDDDSDQRKRMFTNSNCSQTSIGGCSLASDRQVAAHVRAVADFPDTAGIGKNRLCVIVSLPTY